MSHDDREALEQFLIGNHDLARLENVLGEFNLFEALGTVRQELRHSDFLSFLMDPQQTHGLGEDFLTTLLQKVVQSAEVEALPVSAVELYLWDMTGTTVQREWRNIDILLLNEERRLAVAIENKVGSGEHSDQLARYTRLIKERFQGWNVLGIFLSPEGEAASRKEWVPVCYGTVGGVVREILERRSSAIGEEVRIALRHYLQLLERHVVTESEIAELCRQIYRKHRRALDLIFEHRPDATAAVSEYLEGMLAETPAVLPDQSSKSYVRFTLPDWEVPALKQGQGWTKTGRMLLFEFVVDYRGLFLHLVIGPGPAEVRKALFDCAMRSKVLNPSSKQLHKNWNDIWPNQKILKADALEELPQDELEARIQGFWERFTAHDLPRLREEMRPAIDSLAGLEAGATQHG